MTVELKPCPFCGEVPTIKNKSENLALFVCRGGACYGSGMWACFLMEDQDKAIAAWNTRATPDPADLEKLANAVWSEYHSSLEEKWTFRKEHVLNAMLAALRAIEEGGE